MYAHIGLLITLDIVAANGNAAFHGRLEDGSGNCLVAHGNEPGLADVDGKDAADDGNLHDKTIVAGGTHRYLTTCGTPPADAHGSVFFIRAMTVKERSC